MGSKPHITFTDLTGPDRPGSPVLNPLLRVHKSNHGGGGGAEHFGSTSSLAHKAHSTPAPPPHSPTVPAFHPPLNQAPGNPVIETSIERAAYYDAISEAVEQGIDDNRAIEIGVAARARAKEIHQRLRLRAQEDAERHAREAADRAREQTRAEEEAARRQALLARLAVQAASDENKYKIEARVLTETIANASPRWPDDIRSLGHPFTSPLNRTPSLSVLLKQIVAPAVRRGIREGMPDLMIQARILHNKTHRLMDQFCHGLDAEYHTRARDMLLAYRESVVTIETKTATRIAKEWEARANHSELYARIAKLENENASLKKHSLDTLAMNSALQREVQDLRRDNSNNRDEYAILISENARRKLKCASLRRQLKRLRQAIEDQLEETDAHYHASFRDSSRRSRVPLARDSRRNRDSGARESSGNGTDSFTEDSGGETSRKGNYGGNDNRDNLGSDDDINGSEEDLNDEDWETWCRDTQFTKPNWNKSTASKILSQKAPPSVIHIGENPMAGIMPLEDTVSVTTTKRGTDTYSASGDEKFSAKDTLKTRLHAKCKREIERLREVVELERAKVVKYKAANGSPRSSSPYDKGNNSPVSQIISILQDCLAAQERYSTEDKSDVRGAAIPLGSSALTESSIDGEIDDKDMSYNDFLASLQSKESLLWSLLSTLSHHDATTPPAPKFRPTSASTRGTTTPGRRARPQSASSAATSTRGIKSIQVLLHEIDTRETAAPAEPAPSVVYTQPRMRDVYANLNSEEGARGVRRGKPRPKSAPTALRYGEVLPAVSGVSCGTPESVAHGDEIQSQVGWVASAVGERDKEGGLSRWKMLTEHFKNPYANALPPRKPLKGLVTRPRSGVASGGLAVSSKAVAVQPPGGMVGKETAVKWVPRPTDHTAGAHYGSLFS
ncbi:hypothetical protein BC830DRAFT_1167426 [Chytriomyces sp. MP71]|nr:hypothetical protein BC830DRAFT_1167426 [Chytriomyces sp. MP71]